MIKATQLLHNLGQSLWLDNITRGLLTGGTLRRYIDELSITGLTSNPTIFDQAIRSGGVYQDAIPPKKRARQSGGGLFFGLSFGGLSPAARLFPARYVR